MSYKKKKLKESKLGQLKYQLGQIALALRKRLSVLFQRRKTMRLPQTQKIMEALRILNRGVTKNNKRIDEWVDGYINDCILNGRQVEILLQWCSGLGLERRIQRQGGMFVPLSAEIELVQKIMPRIVHIFTDQLVKVSWLVTFNRSYVARRRLPDQIFVAYMGMIRKLTEEVPVLDENIIFVDWDEVTDKIKPNAEILGDFGRFVSSRAIGYEVEAFKQMLLRYPGVRDSNDEITEEAKFRIACESEEARFLVGMGSPFTNGAFILIPLEKPERYVFFDLLAPEFTKRIVSVAKLYPWRME